MDFLVFKKTDPVWVTALRVIACATYPIWIQIYMVFFLFGASIIGALTIVGMVVYGLHKMYDGYLSVIL